MKLLKELLEAEARAPDRPKYNWDEAVDYATETAKKRHDDVLIIQRVGDDPDVYDVIMEHAFLQWGFELRDQYEVIAWVDMRGKLRHFSPHIEEGHENKTLKKELRAYPNIAFHRSQVHVFPEGTTVIMLTDFAKDDIIKFAAEDQVWFAHDEDYFRAVTGR